MKVLATIFLLLAVTTGLAQEPKNDNLNDEEVLIVLKLIRARNEAQDAITAKVHEIVKARGKDPSRFTVNPATWAVMPIPPAPQPARSLVMEEVEATKGRTVTPIPAKE